MKSKILVEIEWEMPEQLEDGMTPDHVVDFAKDLIENSCHSMRQVGEFSNFGASVVDMGISIVED